MKIINQLLVLVLTSIVILPACNDACNDCLILATKDIKYVNANGENLLFGPAANFDPESVIVKTENDIIIDTWILEDEESIQFNLEADYTTYYLELSDLRDTLEFELDERPSVTCCGDVTYSTRTFHNGKEIENRDLILLTH